MNATAPEKGLTPVILPVVLLVSIAAAAFLFGRLLLNVHPRIATLVALMVAFNLLAFFSFMSWRLGKADPIEKVLALGVTFMPILLGVAVAAGVIPVESEAEHGGPAGPPKVALVASNLAFDKSEIELVAGVENEIDLDNRDTQPHNVIVFDGPDATAPPLNDGQPFTNAGQKVEYKIKAAAAPGTKFFYCQIHPVMKGTYVVE
ncbi:MAG: cupredoxin domain-containing protein [Actinomycetota bacterium]